MKKIIITLLLAAAVLSGCTVRPAPDTVSDISEAAVTEQNYPELTELDPCVVEPDVRAALTDGDRDSYRALMNALLSRADEVTLDSDPEKTEYLLDLLRRSPYYFFAESAAVDGSSVRFSYAFSEQKQAHMRSLIDDAILDIVNGDIEPDDNELDVILKIYSEVGRRLEYDAERDDNKQPDSPLFSYPDDEVYTALKKGKTLCQGFVYVLRYALLQRGVDCFMVYGTCKANNMGHSWLIFRYDGEYFNCDPAWDRASDNYAKLLHFGKTDAERISDTLEARPFADYHTSDFAGVECTDERFKIFRAAIRITYVRDHRYYIENRDSDSFIFDTEEFSKQS